MLCFALEFLVCTCKNLMFFAAACALTSSRTISLHAARLEATESLSLHSRRQFGPGVQRAAAQTLSLTASHALSGRLCSDEGANLIYFAAAAAGKKPINSTLPHAHQANRFNVEVACRHNHAGIVLRFFVLPCAPAFRRNSACCSTVSTVNTGVVGAGFGYRLAAVVTDENV